jgi:hypothetical protein
MRWRLSRLGVTQAGTDCVAVETRISGSVGPWADAGRADAGGNPSMPAQAVASRTAISRDLVGRAVSKNKMVDPLD